MASSVRGVVPVTGNFQAETALNPLAQEALLAAFESGWADPKKIGQHPDRAALMRNNAVESIASRLGLSPDQIEITGEVGLGYFLSLAGFLTPAKSLHFGAGDRSGVIATVRSHQGPISEIPLLRDGRINFAESAREMIATGNYFSVQINYDRFTEKPPLFFWLQVLSMKAFGINDFAARFPNAVCGIVTLIMLFRIGKRIFKKMFGMINIPMKFH